MARKEFEVLETFTVPFGKALSDPACDTQKELAAAIAVLASKNTQGGVPVGLCAGHEVTMVRIVTMPQVGDSEIAAIMEFEAKRMIPFPFEEVCWNWKKLQSNQGSSVKAVLVAVKRDKVPVYLDPFHDAGMEVTGLIPGQLAFASFLEDSGCVKEESYVVGLDMGKKSTSCVIAGKGDFFSRSIPIGGDHFKKSDLAQRDFIAEVMRTLGYFTSVFKGAKLCGLVLCGKGFFLDGLSDAVAENTKLTLLQPEKNAGISATFNNALGAALERLGTGEFSVNLLGMSPSRGKQVWGVDIGDTAIKAVKVSVV